MSDQSSNDLKRLIASQMITHDLYAFSRLMFGLRRRRKWHGNIHHEQICDHLMKVVYGEITNLLITLPPRYSKTELAVINFVAWCFGLVPQCEFIHTSYGSRLALHNSTAIRELMDYPEYKILFPYTRIRSDAKSKDYWRTSEGGSFYAVGAGGAITGFGAGSLSPPDTKVKLLKPRKGRGRRKEVNVHFSGAIIIDDPHKADEAHSDLLREGVIEWFQNTLQSRRNSSTTPTIVIMQRLHPNDLAGWIIAGGSGEDWTHLNIPAINPDGTALWPEKHSLENLRQIENKSPWVFASQYMQKPVPLSGNIFRPEWWQYYKTAPTKPDRVVQSWDTAFKTGQLNDYSCCTTWLEKDNCYYLIDLWCERVEFPQLKKQLLQLSKKYKPDAILIEDKASGQSLIQEMRRQTNIPLLPIKADRDKIARAFAITPLLEARRVFLPKTANWLGMYQMQLAKFPGDNHDDCVDSTTQALLYMGRDMDNHGLLEFYDQRTDPKQKRNH